MNKTKVTLFTTIDGRKFYGADSKKEAEEHEKKLKLSREEAVIESEMGQLLIGKKYPVFSGKYEDVDDYWEDVNENVDENGWKKFVRGLESVTICPSEIETFETLGSMITDVVDELGGIEKVQEIMDMYKKHLKRIS
jgi:hypothetical protein